MRNRHQQFVIFIGALLCIGNGGSLFAGMISRVDVLVERSPAAVPAHLVAPNVTPAAHVDPVRTSVSEEGLPQWFTMQPATVGGASAHLAGKSCDSDVLYALATKLNGLLGTNGSTPAPLKPPGRDGGGKAGGMGIVPTNSSRDLPDVLLAYSPVPIQVQVESLTPQSFRVKSDPSSAGLFRPPRER